MMTVFGWMLDGGTHDRLDRMNDELGVLIEDQEKTNTSLEETNDNLKGGQRNQRDTSRNT